MGTSEADSPDLDGLRLTNAAFYLSVAEWHFERLEGVEGPVRLASSGRHSLHFTHAAGVTVFAAFAVEAAISALLWIRCAVQVPSPGRRLALRYARRVRSINERIDFLRAATAVDDDLLDAIRRLFDARNELAHGRITALDDDPVEPPTLLGSGMSPVLIDDAPTHLAIARDALKALAVEVQSNPEWSIEAGAE